MPEWLLKNEDYKPSSDRDAFIDKSILGLLALLSMARNQGRMAGGRSYSDPSVKVALTFLIILLISLTANPVYLIAINAYLLFSLSMMKGEYILRILKASFLAAILTFIILVPALLWGNAYSCMMITPKVFSSVMAVNILSCSTPWNSITKSLKVFFVPDIFILVLEITIKYIVLLGGFSLSMLYALKMRSVGKNNSKNNALSGIAGTMFLKSMEMAEDMYTAMQCRCFTGEYSADRRFKISFADFMHSTVHVCLIIGFLCIGRY